jgi:Protein of unknown function (DUF3060)
MTSKIIIPLIIAIASAAPALAQGSIGTVGGANCNGGPKTVSGMGNNVEISGYCSVLTVTGTGNVVTVDRAGQIIAKGTGNVVYYKRLNPNPKNPKIMTRPIQSNSGTGNVIERQGAE